MFDRLGIHARIALLILAASVPIAALSFSIAAEQRRAAEAHALDDLRLCAAVAAGWVRVLDFDALNAGAAASAPCTSLTVLDAAGGMVAHHGTAVDAQVLRALAAASADASGAAALASETRLHYAQRVSTDRGAGRPYTVVASVSKREAHEAVDRALTRMVTALAVLTLTLAAATWYLAERYVLRSIRVLLRTTQRVREGDLSARTGLTATHDELGQLGSSLDHMADQLQSRDADLRKAVEALHTQAVTDTLTGLYNRRYFDDAIRREVLAARRAGAPFSMILLDIDHFKKVNDTWGHDAGDRVLARVAEVIRGSIRGSDIAVRHGGEEFALLLPATGVEVARERAETLRGAIQADEIMYGEARIRVSASFGVAEYRGGSEEALMKAVDEAMYSAKAGGRNRVVVSETPVGAEGPAPR